MIAFVADASDEGRRIDVVVAERAGVTRALVQRALRSGDVTVTGVATRPSYRLVAGDEVAGEIPIPTFGPPGAEDIPLRIRYEDDRVLVVSKPAGLVTHPARGHETGTLVNALVGLDVPLAGAASSRPGIVHRLDKDTSGLLLVAKDDDAHARLVLALQARGIERRYLALVRGAMVAPSGTIEAPVGRHPTKRRQMAVVDGGRRAVTHYRVVSAAADVSLLDVSLETGRTHQIRVHLSYVGHPILGDRTYGGGTERAAELGLVRPFLHAWRLAFPSPDDGRTIEVSDEVPDDLVRALALAGLQVP
jgi:23S rRNA pseudouridine1911/1915/1917 synthase